MQQFSLSGRAAQVTGGSRGIGRAIALALADAGASVAVCSRKAEACDAVVAEITASGGHAITTAAHIGHADEAAAAVSTAMATFGRLDILVNNAATNPQFGPLIDAPESSVTKIFDTNLVAQLRLCRLVCEAWMNDHGGSIINIASIGGISPLPFIGAYDASKAALINVTKTLARELGPKAIRVNAIAPGLIRTDFARALIETPQIHDSVVATTALGRVGEPHEIAGAAVFLAGEAAAYVTGSVLVVDGGTTA